MDKHFDRSALAVVEAGYELDGSGEEWLTGILSAATPVLDDGLGVMAWTFSFGSDGFRRTTPPVGFGGVSAALLDAAPRAQDSLAERDFQAMYARTRPLDTGKAAFLREYPGADYEATIRQLPHFAQAPVFADMRVAVMADASGHGCALMGPRRTEDAITPAQTAKWERVMSHLLAGLRLRHGLATPVEAILEPGGRVLHAEGVAQGVVARATLREAAVMIDRARAGGAGPDPLATWRGLVRGRWSLVDRFESDGRRYLIARKNDPAVRGPTSLSVRERQVLAYVALGYSNDAIAYALGIASSTVSTHITNARRRLGVRDRVAIAQLFREAPRLGSAE